MIVLSKDREPQAVATAEKSQELVAAVAIPRITPYAQSAVQADFGKVSKIEQNWARSGLTPAGEPGRSRASLGLIGEMVFLVGAVAMPLVFLLSN